MPATNNMILPGDIKRLLIRSTNWIGDAVMTTPALRAVRRHLPGARISILAKPWVAPVFEHNPHADEILIYDGAGIHKGPAGLRRLARELKARRFDAVILFQNAFEAALIAFAARIPVRIGYDSDGRGLLLTHPVRRRRRFRAMHETLYYLKILEGVGMAGHDTFLELHISAEEREWTGSFLAAKGFSGADACIGINPGATYGTAKRWFAGRFAALCKRLQKEWGVKTLIFGGPGEAELGEGLRRMIGKESLNLCGTTSLRQAMALIQRCALFITNDSGLMHVAAALDIPQIAVFGPTNPVTTSPRSLHSRMLRIPTPCSPCLRTDCPKGHHACMDAISTDMVYEAAARLMGKAQTS